MSDPRFVEPRCAATFPDPRGVQLAAPCGFRAGHEGLHSSRGNRWGTDVQLAEEIALAKPIGIVTVQGDLTPEAASAIRRAFRRRDLP